MSKTCGCGPKQKEIKMKFEEAKTRLMDFTANCEARVEETKAALRNARGEEKEIEGLIADTIYREDQVEYDRLLGLLKEAQKKATALELKIKILSQWPQKERETIERLIMAVHETAEIQMRAYVEAEKEMFETIQAAKNTYLETLAKYGEMSREASALAVKQKRFHAEIWPNEGAPGRTRLPERFFVGFSGDMENIIKNEEAKKALGTLPWWSMIAQPNPYRDTNPGPARWGCYVDGERPNTSVYAPEEPEYMESLAKWKTPRRSSPQPTYAGRRNRL
jgi:thioesterase domain-containing protein